MLKKTTYVFFALLLAALLTPMVANAQGGEGMFDTDVEFLQGPMGGLFYFQPPADQSGSYTIEVITENATMFSVIAPDGGCRMNWRGQAESVLVHWYGEAGEDSALIQYVLPIFDGVEVVHATMPSDVFVTANSIDYSSEGDIIVLTFELSDVHNFSFNW